MTRKENMFESALLTNQDLFLKAYGMTGNNPIFDWLMLSGAEYVIYITILLMFAFALKGTIKERKALILIVLTFPIIVLLIKFIHLFYFEPRPFVQLSIDPLVNHQADASFPSRHAAVMASVAFFYSYYRSRWSSLMIFLMLWVGVSRIYVGVHYPLDIIGGFITGIVAGVIAIWFKKALKSRLSIS